MLIFLLAIGFSAPQDKAKEPSQKIAEHVTNPELKAELLRRMKIDQDVRNEIGDWFAKNGDGGKTPFMQLPKKLRDDYEAIAVRGQAIDAENREWLKTVIAKHGWPGKTMVGKEGALAAWLFAQHADLQPEFQKQCLKLLKEQPKGEVEGQHIAYLTDRVLLADGKKQIYGTQLTQENGKLVPRPLEDEANVDKRRAELGMMPLAKYIEFVGRPKPASTDKKGEKKSKNSVKD